MPLPRFTREVAPVTGVTNPSAGAQHELLSRELDDFSARRMQDVSNRLQEQGLEAGTQAGLQGNTGDQTPHGVYQRAFREGALVSHQAALQVDIRDTVGRITQEALDTPDPVMMPKVFDDRLAGAMEGWLKESDPTMQAFIQQRAADYSGRAKLSVIEAQQTQLKKEQSENLDAGLKVLVDDATTAAFEGNHTMVEARRRDLVTSLEKGVAGGLRTQAYADTQLRAFEHEVIQQEVIGEFDRKLQQKGSEEGNKAIERWKATKPSDAGLTVDEHAAVTRQLIAYKNQFDALKADEAFKRDAAYRAELTTRRDQVNETIKTLTEGFPASPDEVRRATQSITWLQQSPDPVDRAAAADLARDFDVAAAVQSHVTPFTSMTQLQRSETITALESKMRSSHASPAEITLWKAYKQADSRINTEMDNDPRGSLVKRGLLEQTPLNFGNLRESLGLRSTQSAYVKQLTGKDEPLLSKAEAATLADQYRKSTIEEKVSLLGDITQGAGDDAVTTLGQLDKTGNKQMAVVGDMVMRGNADLARSVIRGEGVLLSDKTVAPKKADYQMMLNINWAGALRDYPDEKAAYLQAATARYADMKVQQGDISDTYNPTLFKQALNEVLPTARFNTSRVAIPSNATEKSFKDWTETWTDADFVGVAGGPASATTSARGGGKKTTSDFADKVRSEGRLVELGNGLYGVMLTSANDEAREPLKKAGGGAFLLQYPD